MGLLGQRAGVSWDKEGVRAISAPGPQGVPERDLGMAYGENRYKNPRERLGDGIW